MSAKQSAKYLPSLGEGKSPVDSCSGHIRINTLCNVLTTAAVLINNVLTNMHHHLEDCNWPCEQATIALRNSNANNVYRVSQEEWTKLRESVTYVELYRYNPKHLYPKLNGYGDNGQRKVWTSCISVYCTSTAVSPLTFRVQWSHPSH